MVIGWRVQIVRATFTQTDVKITDLSLYLDQCVTLYPLLWMRLFFVCTPLSYVCMKKELSKIFTLNLISKLQTTYKKLKEKGRQNAFISLYDNK